MKAPDSLKKAAKQYIDLYGLDFDYLGIYQGEDAYTYHFPEGICAGFPVVYLVNDNQCSVITEPQSFDILNSIGENIKVIRVK